MKRIVAGSLVGFAVMAGIFVGSSASAAPKGKPVSTTSTTTTVTLVPDPTPTYTVKPSETIAPCSPTEAC